MTHNTREVEERFRNKILDVETAIRLTYNEKDSDQMVQKMLDFIHQELQKAQNCYCKDKAVIELIEENKKDWLREEIVKLEGEKLGGLARPIFVGANAPERMRIHNQALQTIIDRYQSELDQPLPDNPNPHESK